MFKTTKYDMEDEELLSAAYVSVLLTSEKLQKNKLVDAILAVFPLLFNALYNEGKTECVERHRRIAAKVRELSEAEISH